MSSESLELDEKIRSYLVSPNEVLVLGMNDYLRHLIYYQRLMNQFETLCENRSTKCCEISDVSLSPHDIERIAHRLNCSQSEFVSNYCVKHPQYPSILYRFKTKPCVFLENKRCKIYEARPNVCMFFPFLTNFRQEAWNLYEEKNIATIIIPSGCATAMKIKELYIHLEFEEMKT